jgi:hypothetical protein
MVSNLETHFIIPCSSASLEAGEDLFGTASRVDTYFLLEYRGVWEAKAFEQSDLPESVKAYFESLLKRFSNSKLLLVKSGSSHPKPGYKFWVASARESDPTLYEFNLKGYPEILGLDIPAVIADEGQYQANLRGSPLWLVCANGRRDPCCARLGTPVFLELKKQMEGDVWESTHMGGHRFAANLLHLPYGILYGRMRQEQVNSFLEAVGHNQIVLDHYRGRTCYDEPTQAAEYYLRRMTGALRLDAFRLLATQEIGAQEWLVRFILTESGHEHRLRLTLDTTGVKIYQSCRPDKLAPIIQYQLSGHERL